jgi:hypothetical protein
MIAMILALALNFPTAALAQKHNHQHAHGKHVHGAGRMDIAFDGLKGEIDFEVSADAILSSEKSPKTSAEKKIEKDRIDDLISKFKESVEFKGANCQWSKIVAEVDRHKAGKVEHADVKLEADLACEKDIKGFTLDVNLGKHYPGLSKIEVQINANGLQKGAVIDSKVTRIELK